ncbi:uncharacterized protein LOC141823867 [Curcuma longa]|uniref:uncharacterized protein LOC141823867 n=1 Tax=Curcuma longa TaxID=136217 RepID=UPI003D9F27A2
MVREEVGDKYFCILVDEARDISKREQMAIILRFVNNHGILTERFFAIKSVSDTTSLNLKNEISNVLVHHNLQVKKIRGQGYDGASNMRGAWNGLQALFLNDCPYAYYVHCFAHRLQLTLVSAAKDVNVIWEFFSHLDNIINIVTSSTKRIAELHAAQRNEIEYMLAIGECDSGSGANQIGNLQRAGTTRWSSHYDSVKSLIGKYAATCKVFEVLSDHSPNGRAKAEVRGIYRNMASFEFVFILHLMHKILRTTDTLCQILQRKSQDILTAITFVSTTKTILQDLRECGWEEFLNEVKVFCSRNEIDVPDLNCPYKIGRCRQQITVEHHYHFDVFNAAIDFILTELNTRFNESSVELLSLSTTLDPKNLFDSFNSDDICKLAIKFYPEDFTEQDIVTLEYELVHYKLDVMKNLKVSTLVELCQQLTESGRSKVYVMLTRLIHLVLTLPVSTATTERAFSAMKHVKTSLRNKMEDDFLEDCLTLYIERDLTKDIDSIDQVFPVGAEQAIDYTAEDLEIAIKRQFDVVLDTIGAPETEKIGINLLRKGGLYMTLQGEAASLADRFSQPLFSPPVAITEFFPDDDRPRSPARFPPSPFLSTPSPLLFARPLRQPALAALSSRPLRPTSPFPPPSLFLIELGFSFLSTVAAPPPSVLVLAPVSPCSPLAVRPESMLATRHLP